jgi:hypothetical protein
MQARPHGVVNAFNILIRKPVGTKKLGRPTRRCEGNIKRDPNETDIKVVEWIQLV